MQQSSGLLLDAGLDRIDTLIFIPEGMKMLTNPDTPMSITFQHNPQTVFIHLSEVIYMSYRIEYDRRAGKYEVRKDLDIFPWVLGSFCLFLLLTFCFWPSGAAKLKEFLIPGEDAVTAAAFSAMTNDLRCGASILDAVEAFCKSVIHGA